MIAAQPETRAPAALESKSALAAHEHARAFFERPAKERAQETFSFDDAVLADPGVRSALVSTCAGKCAYCETPLAEGIRFERRLFHAMFATDDQKEGMAAFVDKRSPQFRNR